LTEESENPYSAQQPIVFSQIGSQ